MNQTYSQTGNYVAIAGLIVLILSHFGVNIMPSDAETVIGALVSIYGVVSQYFAHKNLAQSVGAIK